MSILIIAEHDNTQLKAATLNTVSAAKKLDDELHILVAGENCNEVVKAASKIEGINKVLNADNANYAHALAENLALLVTKLAEDYTHIFTPATTTGKNFMPRVAALLDVAQISDIVAVESTDTFVRPIYAGNAMATVQSSDTIKLITVRGTAFDPVNSESGTAEVQTIESADNFARSHFDNHQLTVSERPELTSAQVVISGGRGMGNGENFALLENIADKLNGAIGASRAAVDAGYVPNDYQVGQTGKIVAPDLYIAVGISGAIQHLAGMKESKVIVAINKDEDAPIFQIADYGLVADLFEVLPELTDLL
ncbi:MAG: electron transfer flavoprotein subunit alpha [endosymbiont of Galathealinum brachiosum]|uniref:Electron transfer flavoprotein subunit alpha n=1 Tax=endosymbiont of Galathealinum brachiosum TaxID=2200906 RepID=A0A370D716_9GAMM|nr:MAG: electron transfer flavoprotein subunit alpha [endosymbiont of Galathealinum brachiosum]